MEHIKATGLQVNILDPKSRTVCIHIINCVMLKIQIRGVCPKELTVQVGF